MGIKEFIFDIKFWSCKNNNFLIIKNDSSDGGIYVVICPLVISDRPRNHVNRFLRIRIFLISLRNLYYQFRKIKIQGLWILYNFKYYLFLFFSQFSLLSFSFWNLLSLFSHFPFFFFSLFSLSLFSLSLFQNLSSSIPYKKQRIHFRFLSHLERRKYRSFKTVVDSCHQHDIFLYLKHSICVKFRGRVCILKYFYLQKEIRYWRFLSCIRL